MNTVLSKSGKGQEVISRIYNNLKILGQSRYEELVKKQLIHHIVEKGYVGCELTKEKLNFIRFGKGSTKVGYIRVPILGENIEVLRRKYNNNNLQYIFMVIEYGDYKNEGISEHALYDRFISNGYKRSSEMEDIIKIFKEPFTPETLEMACSIIERGADITRLLNESPMTSLEQSSGLAK